LAKGLGHSAPKGWPGGGPTVENLRQGSGRNPNFAGEMALGLAALRQLDLYGVYLGH
jgi:hypothetical protein